MSYNHDGENAHLGELDIGPPVYDPYEEAMHEPPSFFFGLLKTFAWPVIGSRPPGSTEWKGNTTFEDYVEELHGSYDEVRKDPDRFISTNVEFSLTPTDPARKVMTRKMSATNKKKKEFRLVVRPSIEALADRVAEVKNLVPGQFNPLKEFTDIWVAGEFVPNPDNEPDEDWKTWKFLHVYASQEECTAAANEAYNCADDEVQEAAEPDNGQDAAKAALVPFLAPLWEQAGHDTAKMGKLLASNPLLSSAFEMDSPEVQAVMGS